MMKATTLLSLLMFLSFMAFGQEEKPEDKTEEKKSLYEVFFYLKIASKI